MAGEPQRGRLLVATPSLVDPNFRRTVVYLLDHDDQGSLGVVLNRPVPTPVLDVVPAWHEVAAPPATLFSGGPVQPSAAICLGLLGDGEPVPGEEELRDAGEDGGFRPVAGRVGTVDLQRSPSELGVALTAVRVFVGYAGWGPGQLEDELRAGAWFVVDAESGKDGDVLTPEPGGLWRAVLARQGGWLRVLARYPDDPGMN